MQDGCTIYMDSYMASNGLFSKNHLLEVDLKQNRETMAFRMLTTIDLFYSIKREHMHEQTFVELAFG